MGTATNQDTVLCFRDSLRVRVRVLVVVVVYIGAVSIIARVAVGMRGVLIVMVLTTLIRCS